jgi:hypothetical protein
VISKEIEDYLHGVTGVIEATNDEKHYVWERNKRGPNYPWSDTGSGYLATVGNVGDRPICISLLTTTINGGKILFYHATSSLVDHDMIREWLEKSLPVTAFRDRDPRKGLNHTDSTNWVHAIPQERVEP